MPFRPSPVTRRQLDWLNERFGTDQSAITVAIDRLYHQERSAMLSYEAPLEEIDDAVLARAEAVHSEVCGCDDKRCPLTNDIYHWLMEGDRGEGRTVADLVAEWKSE